MQNEDIINNKWHKYLEVFDKIKFKKNVLIICHKKPDGDTIGSAYALGLALKQLGHKIKICCEDELPNKYSYMTNLIENMSFENPDYIIAVDIADVDLMGEETKGLYGDKVDLCIDHHISHKNFSKCDIVFPESAANCENIYSIINLMNINITKEIADCLYTGIVTDTGCFQYINTTSMSHIIAGKLISLGANFKYINKITYGTKTFDRMKLESFLVDSVELFYNGKCAINVLTRENMDKYRYSEETMEGISNFSKNIEGVCIGIMIKEEEKDIFKISIRTDGYPNAQKICEIFGGGGHIGAAGCTICDNLDCVKKNILSEVKKYFD